MGGGGGHEDESEEEMGVYVGRVETFREVEPDKAQALKVLEEASEVFGAWQIWDGWMAVDEGEFGHPLDGVNSVNRGKLLDEITDVIQAACNLAAALGAEDLGPFMRACEERNRERGRL